MIIDAITLRGIGSYLHGARLEIKPLTVLCGSNGSGKSTWLKALNVLKDALDANLLPYGFAIADWSPDNIQLTNAFFHLAYSTDFAKLDTPTTLHDFGTPGTIGLELRSLQDHSLFKEVDESEGERGDAWQFLHYGKCKANMKFRIRIAHPTYWDDAQPTPELRHVIEIQINGRHTIRLDGERDPFQKFEEGFSRPRRSKPYTFSCSRSFLTGNDEDGDEIDVLARIVDLVSFRLEAEHDDYSVDQIKLVAESFENMMRGLFTEALKGFFYIGAVRAPYNAIRLEEERKSHTQKHNLSRHVGMAGENAWWLERQFEGVYMRRIATPKFSRDELHPQFIEAAKKSLKNPSNQAAARILKQLDPSHKARILALLSSDNEETYEAAGQVLADAFNSLLHDVTLFDRRIWGREHEVGDTDGNLLGYEYVIDDPDIEWLVSGNVGKLHSSDLQLLNYLLILEAVGSTSGWTLGHDCVFSTYVSLWLSRLIDTGLNPTASGGHAGTRFEQWTVSTSHMNEPLRQSTPFLLYFDPSPMDSKKASASMARLVHPCFGQGLLVSTQPPRQLSAGFHQVFPIIVQLGLMRNGELIGIENPEVHLHPRLQLRVTEALIEHATSGRRIIVETHSDLVLRRVIRAILEEEIGQSLVSINFAGLDLSATTQRGPIVVEFRGSLLQSIKVDENGRIANWPAGFLDEDVLESQRLMDIMYGSTGSQDDAEDDEDEDF